MSRLLDLFSPGIVIADGAWGTELIARGGWSGEPLDFWNLTRPDDVLAEARGYVEAGSQLLLTNTFRANPISLGPGATSEFVRDLNRAGAELSRRAAGASCRVFGSIGPIETVPPQEVAHAFRQQAEGLAEGDVDGFVLETFSDPEQARIAVETLVPFGLPIVASFAFDVSDPADRTVGGATIEHVARLMAEAGADAVGLNCGRGPAAFADLGRRLKAASGLPLWLKPNAGLPRYVDGRWVYDLRPEAFAAHLPEWIDAGADFVGGCCGTSPAHIAAVVKRAAG